MKYLPLLALLLPLGCATLPPPTPGSPEALKASLDLCKTQQTQLIQAFEDYKAACQKLQINCR